MNRIYAVLAIILLALIGCNPTQTNIEDRNAVLGERPRGSNYQEALQISQTEDWKDIPSKIVNVYIINPVTGGLLLPVIQCMGVPNSSTESLEPNNGMPTGNGSSYWRVPIDGIDILTQELAGRDGTYGDPVHFRSCMDVSGNYHDWTAYGMNVIVTSASYTFPDATVQRDFEAEARLLQAEQIIERGGCVNVETLQEIECIATPTPVPTVEPTPTIGG